MNKYLGFVTVFALLSAHSFAAEIAAPPVSIPSPPGSSPENTPSATAGGGAAATSAAPNFSTMSVSDLTAAAEKGDAAAQFALAEHFGQRNSLDADYIIAQKWYEKAANQGNKDAQYKLGLLYEDALGVTQNVAVAYYWVSLAATGGNKAYTAKKADLEKRVAPEQVPVIAEKVKAFKPAKAETVPSDVAPTQVQVSPAPATTPAAPATGVVPPQMP